MEIFNSLFQKKGLSETERPEININVNWKHLLDQKVNKEQEEEEENIQKEITVTQLIRDKEIFLIDNLLSKEECQRIINTSNEVGFGKTNYPKHYRGNLRLIVNDNKLAEVLWERIVNFVPQTVIEDGSTWTSYGLNDCWRLAKYYSGDRFGAHVDAYFLKTINEKSMYTVNIYLNGDGDFVGGSTRFYQSVDRKSRKNGSDSKIEEARVLPSAGRCVIFRQPNAADYLHDGEEVTEGIKYLLRTDVMYRRNENENNEDEIKEKIQKLEDDDEEEEG
mmetsp:Transcript_14877/g.15594  ORF Transcript_14877/g.15594 Transcript_14877/m.15594 type:complete len:277 (+) Transcript_14877:52-882(+)